MYNFTDITGHSEASLPSEALKINGEYIENQITGYRTLYVSGREALAPELTTIETGSRHGSVLNYRRYPSRTITIGYQLLTDSPESFRKAYNQLGAILNVENSELIFADEPDKFFIGHHSSMGDVETGRNCVTGEFEFTCLDPFKYSVEEYEVSPVNVDGSIAFQVNYGGTVEGYPVLEADFYENEVGDKSTEGRCGYVAFFNENEKILQFGNPEELSEEQIEVVSSSTNTYLVPTTEIPLNHTFKQTSSWNSLKSQYTLNNGIVYKSHKQTGTLGIQHSNSQDYFLSATGYGTGSEWHGPTATYKFANSAKDFTFSYGHKMCTGKSSASKKQRGALQMILSDSSGAIIAGIDVFKSSEGTRGKYRMIVGGKVQKEAEIDLSFYNRYFGSNRTADRKKGITAVTAVKAASITKNGSKVSFNVGGIKNTFTVNAVKDKEVNKVTVAILKKGNYDTFQYNGIFNMKMVRNYQKSVTQTIETIKTEWHDVQNKFNVNDKLKVDCSDATVQLNGLDRPDLGALGNDWDEFYLVNGMNQIGTSYSDWVESTYAPNFKMRYREVFL